MAETKPLKIPRWADTGTRVEPTEGKKDTGWIFEETPPFSFFNWLSGFTGDWLKWLNEHLFEGPTADDINLRGLDKVTADGADLAGGATEISGGQSTGDGGSIVDFKVAKAGQGAGTTERPPGRVGGIGTDGRLDNAGADFTGATGTNSAGVTGTGDGTGAGVSGTGGGTNGIGTTGQGVGTGAGLSGTGSTAGSPGVTGVGGNEDPGVFGTGGPNDGIGVKGLGTGNQEGLSGQGGPSNGAGCVGVGGATNGPGVVGTGVGSGVGVRGTGGVSSGNIGVEGNGAGTDGIGVHGIGKGYGVIAESDITLPTHAAFRQVPQDASPTLPIKGDRNFHATSGLPENFNGTEWAKMLGNHFAGVAASDTISSTGGFVAFTQQYVIPANKLRPGSVIRVSVSIEQTVITSGAVNMRLVSDDGTVVTVLLLTGSTTLGVVAKNMSMDFVGVVKTLGATGSLASSGKTNIDDTGAVGSSILHDFADVFVYDTTKAQTLRAELTWTTAGNTGRLNVMSVDIS